MFNYELKITNYEFSSRLSNYELKITNYEFFTPLE